jgi:hypothetical protein
MTEIKIAAQAASTATKTAPPAAGDITTSKQPLVPDLTSPDKPQAVVPLTQLTLQQRTEQLLKERYVRVDPLTNTSSFFTHRGHCEKCGWQTMQHSEKAAHDLVLQHAWQHWRDVTTQAQAETTVVATKGTA